MKRKASFFTDTHPNLFGAITHIHTTQSVSFIFDFILFRPEKKEKEDKVMSHWVRKKEERNKKRNKQRKESNKQTSKEKRFYSHNFFFLSFSFRSR